MRTLRQNYFKGAFAVFCIGGAIFSQSGWTAPKGRVASQAIVKSKGVRTSTQLRADASFNKGDVVVSPTGKLTSVRFNDGSQVTLNSDAAIEITSGSGEGKPLFRALRGRMAVKLQPGKTVATRTALMRVKGTEFLLDVAEDGTTTLTVVEGTVEIYNPCGDALVHENNQSTVYPGSPPSAPSAVPNIEPLLQWRKALEAPEPAKHEGANFDAAAKIEGVVREKDARNAPPFSGPIWQAQAQFASQADASSKASLQRNAACK